jgi:hypothetical protein
LESKAKLRFTPEYFVLTWEWPNGSLGHGMDGFIIHEPLSFQIDHKTVVRATLKFPWKAKDIRVVTIDLLRQRCTYETDLSALATADPGVFSCVITMPPLRRGSVYAILYSPPVAAGS